MPPPTAKTQPRPPFASREPSANELDGNLTLPRNHLIGRDREVAAIQQIPLQEQVGCRPDRAWRYRQRAAWRCSGGQPADDLSTASTWSHWPPSLIPTRCGCGGCPGIDGREALGDPCRRPCRTTCATNSQLLCFDNFEQILPAAPFVSALLAECRRLKVLVTSRAPLHLYGEHEFSVPPPA